MELTRKELLVLKDALNEYQSLIVMCRSDYEEEEPEEYRTATTLLNRITDALRETALPVGGDRFTVDTDDFPWA